jgi:phosphoglycerate dehydrogenase-like enzyme
MLNVHILNDLDAESESLLKPILDSSIRLTTGSETLPEDSHILVGGGVNSSHLENCPDLRMVVIPYVGLPDQMRSLLLERPHIAVHNLHHNDAMTAEMAVALMMAAAKFIVPFDQALRKGDWGPRSQPNPSLLLNGKTALVLGFGAIGKWVGRACWGLGMRVWGVRRTSGAPDSLDYAAQVFTADRIEDLLPHTHVLHVTLPGTPQTTGLISEKELRLMPPGGILVNVGRGSVVDQSALYQALKNGHLAGAGLDVWYNYPSGEGTSQRTFPGDVPFQELENIVMSPHRGGATRESEPIRMLALAELLNAAACGEEVPNRVDLTQGY